MTIKLPIIVVLILLLLPSVVFAETYTDYYGVVYNLTQNGEPVLEEKDVHCWGVPDGHVSFYFSGENTLTKKVYVGGRCNSYNNSYAYWLTTYTAIPVNQSPSNCSNGYMDADETGIDCGGSCGECAYYCPPGYQLTYNEYDPETDSSNVTDTLGCAREVAPDGFNNCPEGFTYAPSKGSCVTYGVAPVVGLDVEDSTSNDTSVTATLQAIEDLNAPSGWADGNKITEQSTQVFETADSSVAGADTKRIEYFFDENGVEYKRTSYYDSATGQIISSNSEALSASQTVTSTTVDNGDGTYTTTTTTTLADGTTSTSSTTGTGAAEFYGTSTTSSGVDSDTGQEYELTSADGTGDPSENPENYGNYQLTHDSLPDANYTDVPNKIDLGDLSDSVTSWSPFSSDDIGLNLSSPVCSVDCEFNFLGQRTLTLSICQYVWVFNALGAVLVFLSTFSAYIIAVRR